MKEIFKHIWADNFLFFLTVCSIGGMVLLFQRPNVSDVEDLIPVEGTLFEVEQHLVYWNRIKKTENDSVYHFRLNEYPCFFQVSYRKYDGKSFVANSRKGDKVLFHVAQTDIELLREANMRVRSFSLITPGREYLSPENGLAGFGKGYFFYGMIFIPLIINGTIIGIRMKKNVAQHLLSK